MIQIPTSVTAEEAARLADLATDRVVLEVGSWYGHSTVAMAQTAKRVHAVDWHRGDPHAGDERTLGGFMANLESYGVWEKVIAHVGRSADVLPLFRAGLFDLAFIDAYHTTEAVREDIDLVLPLVGVHGFVAFHDYGLFGVKEAVDALEGVKVVDLTGTLMVVRKL